MTEERKAFSAYKGLQRPLVFRGFKGKYIYIAGGVLIGTLMLALGLSNVHILVGAGALIIGGGGGMLIVLMFQKKGLHSKKVKTGDYIISKVIQRDKQ